MVPLSYKQSNQKIMQEGKDIASLNLSLELHTAGFKGEEYISIARQIDLNNYFYPDPHHPLEPQDEYICPAYGVSLLSKYLPKHINVDGQEYRLDQSATLARWHIGYKQADGTEFLIKETGELADSIARLVLTLHENGFAFPS